jgi:hypothetical protein
MLVVIVALDFLLLARTTVPNDVVPLVLNVMDEPPPKFAWVIIISFAKCAGVLI